MYTQEITVNNEVGLHARPATFFIQKANEFKSGIWVEKEDRRVNAKSLLGVLSLGIVKGTAITLIADGSDEKEAVAALVDKKMSEILTGAKVGRSDAAVLAAVNLADELLKSEQTAENLRRQVKDYLDEATQARNEVSDLKRQLFKAQQGRK